MVTKKLFFYFYMLFSSFAMGQEVLVDQEIQTIEGLIQFNEFPEAQRKIEILYSQLNSSTNSNKNTASLLKLHFTQALIYDRQDLKPAIPLEILLEIVNHPHTAKMPELLYRTYLLISLCYEKSSNFELTAKYLSLANDLYKKHRFEHLYSTYCIRIGSYFRFTDNVDSTLHYAQMAEKYALKFGNDTDLSDSKILFSIVAKKKKNYTDALHHSFQLLDYRKQFNDSMSLLTSYNSIAGLYLKSGNLDTALIYNDSSLIYLTSNSNKFYDFIYHEMRYKIFEAQKNIDSAYHHFKQYHIKWKISSEVEQKIETKKLEELYQNKSKDATIKNRNRQLLYSFILIVVISVAAVLIIYRNKKIKAQNVIINKQLELLSNTLNQKQVLLSELQHRVKNNLQHVISILEIQKESVNFNNIEELIRGYQNRIHSIALVHKKLNITDDVNEVALSQYITELVSLVKESYDEPSKKVSLNIKCEAHSLTLEKTLPLGLIIVELVSNSMKHAFHHRNIGIITIEVSSDGDLYKMYYSDNGSGYDFNQNIEKGLGQEIIKGLIDQLDAQVEAKNNNGFELKVIFK